MVRFQLNAAIFYPMALAFGAEALVSIQRIEEFLLKGEKNEAEVGLERRSSLIISGTKGIVIELFTSKVENLTKRVQS